MSVVLAIGTLKAGFPLHHGVAGAKFLGPGRTVQRFPMFIAGPWFAPMVMNEPGSGHQLFGELYAVDDRQLAQLDTMESIDQPGNFRLPVGVTNIDDGRTCAAFVYMKSRALADPIHTEYLATYRDRRFIPPEQRRSP